MHPRRDVWVLVQTGLRPAAQRHTGETGPVGQQRPSPAGSRPRPPRSRAHVATPGPQATTPVNATRANVRPRGREWPTGGRRRASTCRIAAKRHPVPTSRHRAPWTAASRREGGPTPVNATRANVGDVGGNGGDGGQHLPDRGQATLAGRATGHNARERGTGERRDVAAAPAGSRPSVHWAACPEPGCGISG
jgi:hypothetical protein